MKRWIFIVFIAFTNPPLWGTRCNLLSIGTQHPYRLAQVCTIDRGLLELPWDVVLKVAHLSVPLPWGWIETTRDCGSVVVHLMPIVPGHEASGGNGKAVDLISAQNCRQRAAYLICMMDASPAWYELAPKIVEIKLDSLSLYVHIDRYGSLDFQLFLVFYQHFGAKCLGIGHRYLYVYIWRGSPCGTSSWSFSLKFLQFCWCRVMGIWGWSFCWSFFALSVPAKQARKLRAKLRCKLRPDLPPSKKETSPKTSLSRNPSPSILLLTHHHKAPSLSKAISHQCFCQNAIYRHQDTPAEIITEIIRWEYFYCDGQDKYYAMMPQLTTPELWFLTADYRITHKESAFQM